MLMVVQSRFSLRKLYRAWVLILEALRRLLLTVTYQAYEKPLQYRRYQPKMIDDRTSYALVTARQTGIHARFINGHLDGPIPGIRA
jgi:hypothetical protein